MTAIDSRWQEPWWQLQDLFQWFVLILARERPGYQAGFSARGPWPYGDFVGQLSISRDPLNQEFEDLVLTLECAIPGDVRGSAGEPPMPIEWSARDLSFVIEHGDGNELYRMPSVAMAEIEDDATYTAVAVSYVRSVEELVKRELPKLLAVLPVT